MLASKPMFLNKRESCQFSVTYRKRFYSSLIYAHPAFVCICYVIEMFLHCFMWLFFYVNHFGGYFVSKFGVIHDTVPLSC